MRENDRVSLTKTYCKHIGKGHHVSLMYNNYVLIKSYV
jgi:hypothetical protein